MGDDLRWLDCIVERVTDIEIDTRNLMADRLAGHFTAMRACHATRTADVSSYYREGLRPLDPLVVHERARAIFLSGSFPELSAADLDRAIDAVGSDLRESRVFFEANERLLVDLGGHYLLYGGEYLVAIAANLSRLRDYRQALKRLGEPTMFICDVPLIDIGRGILLEFAGMALEIMFEEILERDSFKPDWRRGAGFPIHRTLAPNHIVGHYHPTHIRDPLAKVQLDVEAICFNTPVAASRHELDGRRYVTAPQHLALRNCRNESLPPRCVSESLRGTPV